ncbi:MAG TPA: DUF6496 domain-containing protein [Puia sp.]|jgi:hypothetical protein|nr:DUF6496 domain-containing protein [Puia sp.]
MPTKQTIEAAKRDKAQGKSASTQAGEFVKAEMDRIREGKTGARNTKQAIAIGLSEARRAGVGLKPPARGKTSEKTRKNAERELEKGQRHEPVNPTRSRARAQVQKREGTEAASPKALSKQAHTAAQQRSSSDRSRAAKQAARTKGPGERSAAAKKAARTRAQRGH